MQVKKDGGGSRTGLGFALAKYSVSQGDWEEPSELRL